MTIAEIRGKISHTGGNLSDRMEDLLTSDVFSTCSYVRPETLLLPFLRGAIGPDEELLGHLLEKEIKAARYQFWPRMERSEPDVMIALELPSARFFLVLVEAKYLSSKSGEALSMGEMETAETPRDQLAREYSDLLTAHNLFKIPESKVSGRALVYVTAHRSMPGGSLIESNKEIRRLVSRQGDINLFWTSWLELDAIISGGQGVLQWELPILSDLQQLLERKGLVHFKGFCVPTGAILCADSVYKRETLEGRTGYAFVLIPESSIVSPGFYRSESRVREYLFGLEAIRSIRGLYKRGAL